MDPVKFDRLTRLLSTTPSRRVIVSALAGAVPAALRVTEGEAGKKRCPRSRKCGRGTCCDRGENCCDPRRKRCCGKHAECCNPGKGTGTCCDRPSRCGKPFGSEGGKWVCCPRGRQWLTTTGRVRCCPAGTRALEGITTDDGPCCPEKKFCGKDLCCPDGEVCCNGECRPEAEYCGDRCCTEGQECCNGHCVATEFGPYDACPYGDQCCSSGARCCQSEDRPGVFACCYGTDICVDECAAADGNPGCCTQANAGCCND